MKSVPNILRFQKPPSNGLSPGRFSLRSTNAERLAYLIRIEGDIDDRLRIVGVTGSQEGILHPGMTKDIMVRLYGGPPLAKNAKFIIYLASMGTDQVCFLF